MKKLISKKITEQTTEQHVRIRYEELTGKEGMAPDAAVGVIISEYNLPMEQILTMLVKWGYLNGPMDKR